MNHHDLNVRRNMSKTYEAVGMLSMFRKQTYILCMILYYT